MEQQQIVRHLQMMRTRVDAGSEEIHGFEIARVGGIERCHAVAEHVPDIEVFTVDHHLDAIGASALIAVADVADFVSDALGRDIGAGKHSRRGRTKIARKGRGGAQAQQPRHGVASRDRCHGQSPCWRSMCL
ncbi:MAG TPA: hypothetical protein VG099_21895 [Gemmataceae bacterium]|nr:hypothetical protein [Gemmataceae bacterium]